MTLFERVGKAMALTWVHQHGPPRRELRTSRRIRTVFDHLAEALGSA